MATTLIPIRFKPAPRNQSTDEHLRTLWCRCDRNQKLMMLVIMERLVVAQNRTAVRTKKAAALPIAA